MLKESGFKHNNKKALQSLYPNVFPGKKKTQNKNNNYLKVKQTTH